MSGVLKYKTDCAPNNGYYLIPLYDKVTIQWVLDRGGSIGIGREVS